MPAEQPVVLPTPDGRPRGRRAGGEGAREEIVAAANAEFAERGYERASVRSVARRSGVDPALVRYYFPGGKGELFAVSFAQREVDPARMVGDALAAGPEGMGTRLALAVLDIWDMPGGRDRFRVLFAAAASGNDTLLRDFLPREIVGRVASALTGPDVPARVTLVAAHMAGVLVVRYVLALEPMASMPGPEVARRVGPVIDLYLHPPVEP